MKTKKHINDFERAGELENYTTEELKDIEGTEFLINSIKNLNIFVKEVENIPFISTNYNWFINPSMKLSILKKIIKNYENEDEINTLFIEYFEENMESLIKTICSKYQSRTDIINEAYNAHINKNYYASIVLFLTQIDGISKELKGTTFFMKKEWEKNKVDDDIKTKIAYLFLRSHFDNENNEPPIRHSEGKRKNWKINHINRHQVLHGEVLNFNTQLNSYKVFSLLISLIENLEYINKTDIKKSKL